MMVKRMVTALVLLGALATLGAVPAAGQAQWNVTDVEGGKEFRLFHESGAAILLQCLTRVPARPSNSPSRSRPGGSPCAAFRAGGATSLSGSRPGGISSASPAAPGAISCFGCCATPRACPWTCRPGTVLRRVRERPDRQPVPAAAGGCSAGLTCRPSLSPASLTLARDPAGRRALATACETGTGEAVRPRNPGARRSPG